VKREHVVASVRRTLSPPRPPAGRAGPR
jgi:hypothetical protein